MNQITRVRGWLNDTIIRKLLKNSSWLLSGSVMATALGFIGLGIRARDLGPSVFGILTVITAYIAVIERLTGFRSWIPLIKFGSESRANEKPLELIGYIKVSLFLDFLGCVFGFSIALIFAATLGFWKAGEAIDSTMLIVAAVPLLFNLGGTPTGILRIFDRFRLFTYRTITQALLRLAGTLLVWAMGWGILGYIVMTAITSILGYIWILVAAYDVLKEEGLLTDWRRADVSGRKAFLRFGGWSYLTGVIDVPVKNFDVIVLSLVVSFEAVGVYQVVKKVSGLLAILVDPIYQAIYPQFSSSVANGKMHESLKYGAKIGTLITLAITPIAFIIGISSIWWLGVFLGPEFTGAWRPLCLYLLFQCITAPSLLVNVLFVAAGHMRRNFIISIASSLVYMTFLWQLAVTIGIYGAIVAWFITITFTTGYKLYYMMNRQYS